MIELCQLVLLISCLPMWFHSSINIKSNIFTLLLLPITNQGRHGYSNGTNLIHT